MPRIGAAVPNLRGIGREAEDRAADYLIGQGFTIITRRYTTRQGEIDLVAMEGNLLVFVEVKAKQNTKELPELAVNEQKRQRMSAAATHYLRSIGEPEREVRFDVIAIDPNGLRHHRNAFND